MASSAPSRSIIVVGGGVFGLTAALELRRRGWRVTLLEPGPFPRPAAASTDISKVVRMDYGADALHTALGEASIRKWHEWNQHWGETLYHEDGFLVVTQEELRPGGFEHDSLKLLEQRGHSLVKLDSSAMTQRYPVWAAAGYRHGYFNPHGGWAESGRVIARLAEDARTAGVEIREGSFFARLRESGSKVTGVFTQAGEEIVADRVLIAAGAWTPTLLPQLASVMWATGQPIVHFQVPNAAAFQAPRFPVWAADIARTGWYGFPALNDGTLKLGNHGPGRRLEPDAPREVLPAEIERGRAFVHATFPAIAEAPVVHTRVCLYCDTFDGAFWIDHDPERAGLVVAAGDSGHAFKFAPMLGGVIADVVERKPNDFAARYRWRTQQAKVKEGARWKGE